MNSSKPTGPRQVPPPPNSRAAHSYTRFIPREELQDFASWTPGAFGDGAAAAGGPQAGGSPLRAEPVPEAPADPEPTLEEWLAQVNAARQDGYQAGYRDGLVALESFKQSFAQQMNAQFGRLIQSFDSELGALEQSIATSVARVATQLARQVVRAELSARPELIAQVAQDAVNAVLMSARHITVQIHPEDQALVTEGALETLEARGARMIGNPTIERGGCLVESDAGTIDARIEARWLQATEALGTGVGWQADTPVETPR